MGNPVTAFGESIKNRLKKKERLIYYRIASQSTDSVDRGGPVENLERPVRIMYTCYVCGVCVDNLINLIFEQMGNPI